MISVDSFLDELEKIALHADDRLRERAPEVDPQVLEDLRDKLKVIRLPRGRYYTKLKTRKGSHAGYAAIKTVPTRKGPIPVLATVLGPEMMPGGRLLDDKLEKVAGVGWDLHGYHQDPDDADPYGREDARITTPYDDKTSYKLNLNLDAGHGFPLQDHTTDLVYGRHPVEKRLGREDLRKVLDTYGKFQGSRDPSAKALIAKGEYLLKHPSFKFARLEYE